MRRIDEATLWLFRLSLRLVPAISPRGRTYRETMLASTAHGWPQDAPVAYWLSVTGHVSSWSLLCCAATAAIALVPGLLFNMSIWLDLIAVALPLPLGTHVVASLRRSDLQKMNPLAQSIPTPEFLRHSARDVAAATGLTLVFLVFFATVALI